MRARIFLDSPAAIQSQKQTLGLSHEQTQMLSDIENEARARAWSVLTDDQRKKIGNVSAKAVTIMDVCPGAMVSEVQQLLERFMSAPGQSGPFDAKE
jgi:hypothetical protein